MSHLPTEGERPQQLDLEFVKELYLLELDSKHKLDSRMATLVVILSAVAGLLLYASRTFTPGPLWFNILTIVALAAGGALWAVAFIRLIQGTLNHKYEQVPVVRDIDGTFTALQDFYATRPDGLIRARRRVEEKLVARMIEAEGRNRNSNLTRAGRYYSALIWMTWAVASGLVAGTGVTIVDVLHEVQTRGEQVSNDEKLNETPQAPGQAPTQQPVEHQPARPPAADSTAEPSLPLNTIFKGNDTPLTPRAITGEGDKNAGKK